MTEITEQEKKNRLAVEFLCVGNITFGAAAAHGAVTQHAAFGESFKGVSLP
ncbi:MAG: hypothetical protein AB7V08_03480 [Elusimicrobiales bacterium]